MEATILLEPFIKANLYPLLNAQYRLLLARQYYTPGFPLSQYLRYAIDELRVFAPLVGTVSVSMARILCKTWKQTYATIEPHSLDGELD